MKISRRNALAAGAAATLTVSAGTTAQAAIAGAELPELEALAAEIERLDSLYDQPGGLSDDESEAVGEEIDNLLHQLFDIPARGPAGVLAKMRSCYPGGAWQNEVLEAPDTQETALLISIRADLERLAGETPS